MSVLKEVNKGETKRKKVGKSTQKEKGRGMMKVKKKIAEK
jgi:hypothetical protein